MPTLTTTEELSTLVREAATSGQTIAPTGGRTKLGWGNPTTADVEISTGALTGVREHSWQDLTATVAAGTTWADMQRALAQHGQQVALDPLFPERATVGGILATNDSGLLRLKYGSLRDLILGMTIVLADGTIARTGGKVVKNVAGYDLPKLLTGSFGTLGLITEATFRLHPVPQHTATYTVRSPEIAPLADLMSAILKAHLSLEAMQLRTETLAFALDIHLATTPELLATQADQLSSLASTLSVRTTDATILSAREQLFANPEATVLKITCLPTKLAAIIQGIAALNAMPEHTAACVADPVGIITAAITTAPELLAILIADLRSRLLSTGGAVVILQRGVLPPTADIWGPPPAPLEVMRSIKQEFDPQRLLNPGKFVGGL